MSNIHYCLKDPYILCWDVRKSVDCVYKYLLSLFTWLWFIFEYFVWIEENYYVYDVWKT